MKKMKKIFIAIGIAIAYVAGAANSGFILSEFGAEAYKYTFVAGTVIMLFLMNLVIGETEGDVIANEESRWRPVAETSFIFDDPEIEAMWNRSHWFVSRGLESPKGPLAGKEDA